MHFSTTHYTFLLSLLIALLTSCQKDSVDPEPVSCRLETYRIVGTSTRTFRYNTDKLPYIVSILDEVTQQIYSVDTLKYDAQKRLVKIRNFRDGSILRDYTFQYSGTSLYPSGYVQTNYVGTYAYDIPYRLTFNAAGQLTWFGANAATVSTNEKTLTYDAAGIVDKITEQITNSPYSYPILQSNSADNKPTPWASSFPLKLFSFIRLGFWDAFSTHNITSAVVLSSVTTAGNNPPIVETVNQSTTYQFDTNGNPISQVEKRPTTTLESRFTYQCP